MTSKNEGERVSRTGGHEVQKKTDRCSKPARQINVLLLLILSALTGHLITFCPSDTQLSEQEVELNPRT